LDIHEKLKILSGAAKYDVSCSSSGSTRKNKPNGIGNAAESGICHSFAADGRCISLLKILLTNYCVFDCTYCVNRSSNDVPRAAFTPEEVADLTINFYKRNYIEGLFLSSAIIRNPNYTMELLYNSVNILRNTHNFNGYIHVKAIPGADSMLIKKTGELVDRMSVNIELPSNEGLKLLAPQKNTTSILKPMSLIGNEIIKNKEERKLYKSAPIFVPAGQSTQLIVGATKDSDLNIMTLSENLYNNYNLKRVYYSAYVPVNSSPKLPKVVNPPLIREHRLYQADWLLRFYGFKAEELLSNKKPNLDINFDPKTDWALSHIDQFPIEVNLAPDKLLLRVPGIGVRSVQRIVAARKVHALTFEDLRKLGIVLKRAQYFITCRGRYFGDVHFNEDSIRYKLTPKKDLNILENPSFEQLTFFTGLPALYKPADSYTSITGEM
jgi:putative DNA modification/repair radical SAM protein